MTTDFRALCAELADELTQFNAWYIEDNGYGLPALEALLRRSDAALAEPDEPAVPEGREPAFVVSEPTYDDLSELCSQHGLDVDSWPLEKFDALWETARAVLARWRTPNLAETRSSLGDALQPVPVSERLPGPKDCDAEGRCWVWWKNGVRWVLDEWTHHELREGLLSDYVSHWLPAHAISIPTAND